MKSYIFILIALLFSCKSAKVDGTLSDTYKLTINSALGESWESEMNPKNNYILAIESKESNPKQPVMERRFVILNDEGTQVYKGQINGGYVKWFSETMIEYYNYVGIMPKDAEKADFTYIYDIVNETTVKKSELSN